jgi:hypothetical protein
MLKKLEARPLLVFVGAFMTVLFFISGQALTAKAVTVTADMSGELVKGSAPTVYFVGSDNKKYLFPNETVFYSWYKDFSSVKTVTDTELAALPVGGDVVAKAGAHLVKSSSDTKVYVVASDGSLQWVSTEAVAQQLFGANWSQTVQSLSGGDFSGYKIGDPINSVGDFNATGGQLGVNPVSPAENANMNTNAPVTDAGTAFKILSVAAAPESAATTAASVPQVWDFDIAFSAAPAGARLTVSEKTSGAVFYNEPIIRSQTTAPSLHVVIGNATAKLKMNTVYSWKVTAYAVPNATAAQIATSTGEFATARAAVVEPETNTNTPATNTNANTSTAVPGAAVIGPFKIVSVDVEKVDAQGKAAEDVRTFRVVFSKPAIGARLTITEKIAGTIFYSDSIPLGIAPVTTAYATPDKWTAKLKPSTAYSWKVTANGMTTSTAGSQLATDNSSGDFTTTDFVPTATMPVTTPPATDQTAGTPPVATTVASSFAFCPTGDGLSQGCCASGNAAFAAASLPITPGTLIRGTSSPMVYYYSSNGKRYVFTGKDVLASWYNSTQDMLSGTSSMCQNVKQLADSDISTITIGGNVDIRPGTYIIKIASDPALYVVSRGRTIHKLASTSLAELIFPGTSTQRLRVVPDAFFTGYAVGSPITSSADYNPTIEYGSSTIEQEVSVNK